MIGVAKSKNIPYSPYKIRPLANAIRGKSVLYALQWLKSVYRNQRTVSLRKTVYSAVSNMLNKQNLDINVIDKNMLRDVVFLELKIDQGPIKKYFRPGAQGRPVVLRARYAHITVKVESKKEMVENVTNKNNFENKGELGGAKG